LAEGQPRLEGILLHGVYISPNLGVDESVAWGDTFL